jgi:hypothetical protein
MKVIGMGEKFTLLLPVIVLFISKFWMVPFRKSKKTVKYYRTQNQLEKRLKSRLKTG